MHRAPYVPENTGAWKLPGNRINFEWEHAFTDYVAHGAHCQFFLGAKLGY